ncbi:LuxR C-terminal-related transcriptional regulator [Alistipes sp. OttesenSCG-928-L06]|nr:LuxR C-terminal-related transcriptional regulator [Alistipes sp. OttesenSCG-928-L06]
MKGTIRITVAEPSAILRGGVIALLKQMNRFHAEVYEVESMERLSDAMKWQRTDILMVNPAFLGAFSLPQVRKEAGNSELRCVALQFSLGDGSLLREYDEVIGLYDSVDQIREKLTRLVQTPVEEKRTEPLSQREKEVVVEVVKGLTNKQIADKLCLSAHTVITHRRNIASKLGIHSTAGLTIYAIVNKLVELNDIQNIE